MEKKKDKKKDKKEEKKSGNAYSYKYPHPAVTTDCVIFGFDGKDLHILLVERGGEPYKGYWALPGGFLNMDETVEECALRELKEETNVSNVFLEQFHTFSAVDRDPRERVLTVAFYALVKPGDYEVIGGDDAARAQWFEQNELPPLAFDHDEVISMAKECLREKLRTKPIAFKLLDDKFTMTELQNLYEVILGTKYDRRNFYRKARSSGFLADEGVSERVQASRRPVLYSFDEEKFDENDVPVGKFPFDF